MKPTETRIIISGGGTGGHLFPALAIAEALVKLEPAVNLLFVGALGKIEMNKVPAAGYRIIGLDIRGLQRSLSWQNLYFPVRLLKSLFKSRSILKKFKPQAVVGVGGYASGPVLFMAEKLKVPSLIQEQNSFPGITNKLLAHGAARICVAYGGMEKFFPKPKLILTGNPVRSTIVEQKGSRDQALAALGLRNDQPVLLVLGGSLGARTLNDCFFEALPRLAGAGIQLIWQTGSRYYADLTAKAGVLPAGIFMVEFITDMDQAYAAADLIISRAGAGTISELAWAGKPVILVPSPNVAEDHQTRNAQALVKTGAALMVTDAQAPAMLVSQAMELIDDAVACTALGKNISLHAYPDAALKIAKEILVLVNTYKLSHEA